jgi:hypothetical protein
VRWDVDLSRLRVSLGVWYGIMGWKIPLGRSCKDFSLGSSRLSVRLCVMVVRSKDEGLTRAEVNMLWEFKLTECQLAWISSNVERQGLRLQCRVEGLTGTEGHHVMGMQAD